MRMPAPRVSTAWLLYFSVLFATLACAIVHGQMAGLRLSGLEVQACAFGTEAGTSSRLDAAAAIPTALQGGCAIASSFSAILLAAFFGGFGLLNREAIRPLLSVFLAVPQRHRWPSLNPRASPRT